MRVNDRRRGGYRVVTDHVTRLENTVRRRWSTGDVVIWDNRATQHKAIDDYGDQSPIVRRVTPAVSPLRFCRGLPAFRFVGPMSLAIS